MQIIIRAIGKERDNLFINASGEYIKRLGWDVKIFEVVSQITGKVQFIQEKEGRLLLDKIEPNSYIYLLDERGDELNSNSFANHLIKVIEQGVNKIYFLIGGAHGHGEEIKKAAHFTISLSQMTLPHKLARLVLIEQIYRAYTLLKGHPYHK